MAKTNVKTTEPKETETFPLEKRGKNALGGSNGLINYAMLYFDDPNNGIQAYDQELKAKAMQEEQVKKDKERSFGVAEQLQTAKIEAENGAPVTEETTDLAETLRAAQKEVQELHDMVEQQKQERIEVKAPVEFEPLPDLVPFADFVFENGVVVTDNTATPVKAENVLTEEELNSLLIESALNADKFTKSSLLDILVLFDKDVFDANVNYVIQMDPSLELANIFYKEPRLLVDPELTGKLEVLLNSEKTVADIVNNPQVLFNSLDALTRDKTIKVATLKYLNPEAENNFAANISVLNNKIKLTEEQVAKYYPVLAKFDSAKFVAIITELGDNLVTEYKTFNYLGFMAIAKEMEQELTNANEEKGMRMAA